MTNLLFTFAIGLLFGYIFYITKIPGGMMVGAIVGVALFNIFFDMAYMPSYAKYTAQIMAGAYIGCSVEKEDIERIKYLVKPSIVLVSGLLILNISLGFIIYFTSPLDLITSLMSCVPGGMTEIPIISSDMGADMPKVAVLQFIRMITCIGLFPSMISVIGRHDEIASTSSPTKKQSEKQLGNKRIFALTMAVAVITGVIGKLLGIPAGMLLFSMIGVICIKLFFNTAYMPLWAKRLAQALSGAFIGSNFGYKDILELNYLLLPAILIVIGYSINCFVVGKILNKRFQIPIKESMLAATPAGATDMALISSDIGVHSTDLVVMQIIRLIAVISIFPQVIHFISRWFG